MAQALRIHLREKFYLHLEKIFATFFIIFLIAQICFWFKSEKIKPDPHIVPQIPSKYSIAAFSLGDKQFYFRTMTLRIENAGDNFGRFTALLKYDYELLYEWFKILDSLDNQSKYVPTMAATYYSLNTNKKPAILIAKYLEEYGDYNPEENWWWYFQAYFLSSRYIKDDAQVMRLAKKLSNIENKNMPVWAKRLEAMLYNKMGDDCAAFLIIKDLVDEYNDGKREISVEELDFMRYFIKAKLVALKEKNFDPKNCKLPDEN